MCPLQPAGAVAWGLPRPFPPAQPARAAAGGLPALAFRGEGRSRYNGHARAKARGPRASPGSAGCGARVRYAGQKAPRSRARTRKEVTPPKALLQTPFPGRTDPSPLHAGVHRAQRVLRPPHRGDRGARARGRC